jgi:hypothetical protein
MPVDPRSFHPYNVTDTCAVWNVLSSATLYQAARTAGCNFICTAYVIYECLIKPRKSKSEADETLKTRLERARASGQFQTFHLDLDDIAEADILNQRQRVGKGELSSIAFARKHRQAVMTDDQRARRLGSAVKETIVQTTPHLLGWLFYSARLLDGDLATVISEHEEVGRPLRTHFEIIYNKALELRAMEQAR